MFRMAAVAVLGLPAFAAATVSDQTAAAVMLQEEQPARPEPSGLPRLQLAQFELPRPSPGTQFPPPPPGSEAAARLFPQRLTYQWALGSESDITYRTDPDLNKRVRDNSLILGPQLNGYITYRPSDWLEATLEMLIEREIAAREVHTLTLPSGEVRVAEKRQLSLAIDQAFVKLKPPGKPYELWTGRINFEDDRHWLYDTSLDVALVRYRQGYFQAQASMGRKDMVDGDLLRHVPTTRINNYILYMDYRGVEDVKLGAYTIMRDDLDRRNEGRPRLMGVNALGAPSRAFSYWGEFAVLRGRDEAARRFSGHAFDVGGTYRFLGLPFFPNVTLAYAAATGDRDPADNVNNEFRQTGLHSNESRFAGVAKFKTYGETLDPDLSNLKIVTAGLGFIPTPNVTVDVVLHGYRLDRLADEIRGSAITAQMAQVDSDLSRNVGRALDVVFGFRSLFGYRRLGMDLRMGWFFPGKAFLRNDGTDTNPDIQRADRAFSMMAKFWWIW